MSYVLNCLILNMDFTRPSNLYRYSERIWLERSLKLGEFRVRAASDYKKFESDSARHDDELVRIDKSPGSSVIITNERTGERIVPVGDVTYRTEIGTNYLTVCFSQRWNETLFDVFPDTDACLVIHNVDEFIERFHFAASSVLPESQWIGLDAPVEYGRESCLGGVFSKPNQFRNQHEWRFAWLPVRSLTNIEPVIVKLGNIESIAEIVDKPL